MSVLNFRTVFFCVIIILSIVSVAFTDVVIDSECDNNENDWGFYWYYYDDNAGPGKDDRPQAAPSSVPSNINVMSPGKLYRNLYSGDNFKQKAYVFTPNKETGHGYAQLPYTMGSTWKTSWGTAEPFVGMGTMLADKGKAVDLTGATGFRFKIRSHVSDLIVTFKVQTLAIDNYSEVQNPPPGAGAYYQIKFPVNRTWTKSIILMSELKLPTLATGEQSHHIPFDIKDISKVVWEVNQADNKNSMTDTLDIDEVAVIGINDWPYYKPWNPMTVPTSGVFTTFENAVKDINPLGFYWYAFNDAAIGGSSVIDPTTATLQTNNSFKLKFWPRTGSDDIGHAAAIKFMFGPTVKQGNNDIPSFVSIGTDTYDSSIAYYWNAEIQGVKSVYFQYALMGDISKASIEILDKNDVGDAIAPTRKYSRGPGVVWHRDIPFTGEVYREVEIPLDSFVCEIDKSDPKFIPLDKCNIAKIQWKVQGVHGNMGILCVDNVYFPGGFMPADIRSITTEFNSPKKTIFNAIFKYGFINITLSGKPINNGTLSLVNMQGKCVAIVSVTSSFIPAKNLPSGLYFVKMNAVDTNGKSIVSQVPVSIIR